MPLSHSLVRATDEIHSKGGCDDAENTRNRPGGMYDYYKIPDHGNNSHCLLPLRLHQIIDYLWIMKEIFNMSQRITLRLAVAHLDQTSNKQWTAMPIEPEHPLT